MENQFAEGDIVLVKSGGPLMTAESVGDHYGTPSVWCVWFEGTKLLRGTFAATALKKSEMPSKTLTPPRVAVA